MRFKTNINRWKVTLLNYSSNCNFSYKYIKTPHLNNNKPKLQVSLQYKLKLSTKYRKSLTTMKQNLKFNRNKKKTVGFQINNLTTDNCDLTLSNILAVRTSK